MRRNDREITDIAAIRGILNDARVMHLGMIDLGEPYVVPVNYGYTLDDEGALTLWFHSATAGRKLDILKENPSVFCTVSIEDGLKGEGDIACTYGYAYRSVMASGHAALLTDPEEKKQALDLLMERQTGKSGWDFGEGIHKVAVVRIRVEKYTAKQCVK